MINIMAMPIFIIMLLFLFIIMLLFFIHMIFYKQEQCDRELKKFIIKNMVRVGYTDAEIIKYTKDL